MMVRTFAAGIFVLWFGVPAIHAQAVAVTAPASAAGVGPAMTARTALPTDYVIGPEDVLSVVFWREKELSADVAVRPDGRITLPLINDIDAAGLTPAQLRERVIDAARPFLEDPTATVIVKQINSRKVFITGEVQKPGSYPLVAPTTVLHLIAMAGGLREFTLGKKIVIMRTEAGRQKGYRFNYAQVRGGKNLAQNIELKPGDTVVVP